MVNDLSCLVVSIVYPGTVDSYRQNVWNLKDPKSGS